MLHTVSLNTNQQIELRAVGLVTTQDNLEVGKKMLTLATELGDRGLPVRLLCDFTDWAGDERPDVVLRGAVASDLGIDRVAVYGIKPHLMDVIEKSAAAGGVSDKIKFFATRDEAEAWLAAE